MVGRCTFLLLILLTCGRQLYAQTCQGASLTTQAEVDGFLLAHDGCEVLEGDLVVQGADIMRFSGLNQLTEITGNLIISTTGLTAISHSFQNLQEVGGDIILQDNPSLGNVVHSFLNVKTIGGRLDVSQNPALFLLQGFEQLTNLGTNLYLIENNLLAQIPQFNGLEEVGFELVIRANGLLSHLDGFSSLHTVQEDIRIVDNPSLSSILGFQALEQVGDDLSIQENHSLSELVGFNALSTIGDNLDIELNDGIEFIEGFTSLTQVGDDFDIQDNPSLQKIIAFENLAWIGEDLEILRNEDLVEIYGFNQLQHTCGLEIKDNPSLASISGFERLDSICGSFEIANNSTLVNIEGFDKLTKVSDFFAIGNNPVLSHLAAMYALEWVGGDFRIQDNAFVHLDRFISLRRVGGDFTIRSENLLLGLGGFSRLQFIGADLDISNNELLKEIAGFNGLAEVGDDIFFEFNLSMKLISGFAALQQVGNDFFIRNNDHLAHIKGFGNLSIVGDDLRITNNPLLQSILAFSSLVTLDVLQVENNPELFYCCGLTNVLLVMGYNTLMISGNAPGCNSAMEILAICDATLSDCNPNCVGQLNVALDRYGVAIIRPSDFILDTMECSDGLEIWVENKWGATIFGPQLIGMNGSFPLKACQYLHNQPLKLVARSTNGTCWTDLTFKEQKIPTIPGISVSTVLCNDPLVSGPLEGTTRTAWLPCQEELEATFVTDWIETYPCEPGINDTVKIIYREWEAFGKSGERGVKIDTIIVLQLPEITAENIYCEGKDSLFCGDSLTPVGPYITYEDPNLGCQQTYLVEVTDIDKDGMLEFAPRIFDPLCGLTVFVDYTKFPGNCEMAYRVKVEIKQECYGAPQNVCVAPLPAGTLPNVAQQLGPGYWRCDFWVVDLDTLPPITHCKGDPLFSGPFAYEYFDFFSGIISTNSLPVAAALPQTIGDGQNFDFSGLPYVLKVKSDLSEGIQDDFDLESGEKRPLNTNGFLSLPFSADAVMSYTADQTADFKFTWDFTLAEIQDDFLIQTVDRSVGNGFPMAAAVSIFYSINGESFRLIDGDPFENFSFQSSLKAKSKKPDVNILDPIAVTESQSGFLTLPLRAGDQLYIVAIWDSPADATFRIMGQNIVSTSTTSCEAHAYLPPLFAIDECRAGVEVTPPGRGVKQVKATVEEIGTLLFSWQEEDECWASHERLKLPHREEPYKIIYEIADSCHNATLDSCYLIVKDLIKPTPVFEKGLTINLTDKKVWVHAEDFDEGSVDNCELNYFFVRRADWFESCVNLCDSLEPICVTKHHDTLFIPYLTPDKRYDPVEAHYAQFLGWLENDAEACHELLFNAWQYDLLKYTNQICRDHPYDLSDDLLRELISECAESKAFSHYFKPVPTHLGTHATFYHPTDDRLLEEYAAIGGGWSDAVPFDCSDACQPVTVEVLAMDYWCNWSIGWTRVWVEDKTQLEIAKNVTDQLTISCKSYRDHRYQYPDITHDVSLEYVIDRAKEGDAEAFPVLDEFFGGYQKVWRSEYGSLVDESGDSLICDLIFVDSVCVCTIDTIPVRVYDEHLGFVWIDSIVSDCYYYADTLALNHGAIVTNCAQNVQCKQEVWCDLDHCGEGYIYRKFKIWSQCDLTHLDSSELSPGDLARIDSAQHVGDTITREQRIRVTNHCALNKYMFEVPADTVLTECAITYDDQGNVSGLASPSKIGKAKYKFDDDCRIIGISHNDRVFKIVGGEEGCYKVRRTWYFADWCGYGVPTSELWWKDHTLITDSCIQEIIIVDTVAPKCTIQGPVADGGQLEVGTCDYHLQLNIGVEDACGVVSFAWSLKDVTDSLSSFIYDRGTATLAGKADEEINLSFTALPHGKYKLKVETGDACNNEGVCEYLIDIIAVKKPTPICITSLTTRLTPWDSDQDGVADTAKAILRAADFNVSSLPACQDTAVEYRIELIDGIGDDVPAGDTDSLVIGCDQFGSNLVRLWVRSLPSMTTDYCDVILIVQSDFSGCGNAGPGQQGTLREVNLDEAEVTRPGVNRGQLETDGGREITGISDGRFGYQTTSPGAGYTLEQNRPNPFQNETTIGFVLPKSMPARITIFDLTGRVLRSYGGDFQRGYHQINLRRDELAAGGVLYYRLDTETFTSTRKMILIE